MKMQREFVRRQVKEETLHWGWESYYGISCAHNASKCSNL